MKKIITLMLAAIVAVLTLSSCASVAAPEHEAAPPAGAETSGFEISAERSSGIRLTSEEATPAASSGYTLTATLEPEGSSADLLNWELSFVNPSSSWASGKSVGSYVTMTVSGFTATLSCKAAFGEPMTVTVSVKSDSTIKASCRLEYRQKMTFKYFSIGGIRFSSGGTFYYENGLRLAECRFFPMVRNLSETFTFVFSCSEVYTKTAYSPSFAAVIEPTEVFTRWMSNNEYTGVAKSFSMNENNITNSTTSDGTRKYTGKINDFFNTNWACEVIGGEPSEEQINSFWSGVDGNVSVGAWYNVSLFGNTFPILLDFGALVRE